MADLSVILVNYNGRRFLEPCLESLINENRLIPLEIIFVDNASTDGSAEFVKRYFSDVTVIRNKKNAGFSRANNRGFAYSGADLILFLNTDTVVEPGALKKMVDWMNTHPDTGALGPVLYGSDDRYQVSFGGRRTFVSELLEKTLLNTVRRKKIARMARTRKSRRKKTPRVIRSKKTVWLSGAALLVRRDAFVEAGGFDENYFLYFEDIDVCYRIGQEGWKVKVLPRVRIYHEGGASTAALSLRSRYYYRQSQLYFYRKYNSRLSSLLLRQYLRLNLVLLSLKGAWRGSRGKKIKEDFHRLLRERK